MRTASKCNTNVLIYTCCFVAYLLHSHPLPSLQRTALLRTGEHKALWTGWVADSILPLDNTLGKP